MLVNSKTDNINTYEYWENKYSSFQWEQNNGKEQTKEFMITLLHHLPKYVKNDMFNSSRQEFSHNTVK